MRYSIFWKINRKNIVEKVDEVIFSYNDNIVNYLKDEKFKDKRIIVDVNMENNIFEVVPILKKLRQEHKNMVVRLPQFYFDIEGDALREAKLPYFFSDICNTEEQVYGFINKQVTDVYIANNLGFNLKEVGQFCKKKHIKVRVYPHIAQYSVGQKETIPAAYKFFIRPEDTKIYEDYVDVFEFENVQDSVRLNTLIDIYKAQEWRGDLRDLISELDERFMNNGVASFFGEQRLKCRHQCMLNKCNICLEVQKLSNNLKANKIIVSKKKEEQ